jgi:hypothetical protein
MSLVSDKATTRLQQSPARRSQLKSGSRAWCALLDAIPQFGINTIDHCLGFHYCGVVIVGGCQSCAEAGFVASLATGESA